MPKAAPLTKTELAWRTSNNIVDPFLSGIEDAAATEFFRNNHRAFFSQLKIAPINLSGKIISFEMNNGQLILDSVVEDLRARGIPVRVIICKARRAGISTYIEARAVWRIRFWKHANALLLSFEKDSAAAIFKMTELFWAELPDHLRPPRLRKTIDLILFGNPDPKTALYYPGLLSQLQIGTAKILDKARGSGIHFFHGTEASSYVNGHILDGAIFPTIPKTIDGYGFIESTSSGAKGYFYNKFTHARDAWEEYDFLMREEENARKKAPEWKAVFLPFWVCEDYTHRLSEEEVKEIVSSASDYEKALVKTFKNITWHHISWMRSITQSDCNGSDFVRRREFPCTSDEAFTYSGAGLFNMQAVQWIKRNTAQDPVAVGFIRVSEGVNKIPYFVSDPAGNVLIWEWPDPNDIYAAGCDAAFGKRSEGELSTEEAEEEAEEEDRDYSTICVLNSKRKQVAAFSDRVMEAFEFADELHNLCCYYSHVSPSLGTLGAFVNIEAGASVGMAVVYRMRDQLGYTRFALWEKFDSTKKRPAQQYVGWEINWKAKGPLVGTMQYAVLHAAEMLRTEACGDHPEAKSPKPFVRSKSLVQQMEGFVQLGDGSIGGRRTKGSHDDEVIAWGLSLIAWEQQRFLIETLALAPAPDPVYSDDSPYEDLAARRAWMEY